MCAVGWLYGWCGLAGVMTVVMVGMWGRGEGGGAEWRQTSDRTTVLSNYPQESNLSFKDRINIFWLRILRLSVVL